MTPAFGTEVDTNSWEPWHQYYSSLAIDHQMLVQRLTRTDKCWNAAGRGVTLFLVVVVVVVLGSFVEWYRGTSIWYRG